MCNDKMNALIVGCGSAGERHLQSLRKLDPNIDIMVYDLDGSRAEDLAKKYKGVRPIDKYHKCDFDFLIIATPPSSHIHYGNIAIGRGVDMFIEKPLALDVDQARKFVSNIRKSKVDFVVRVGYNMRYHPDIMLMKDLLEKNTIGRVYSVRAEFGQDLRDWHPKEDYRKLYVGKRDCGLILDASHEVDYLMWLLGDVKSVGCMRQKSSSLQIESEDVAEILLDFKSGVVGSVHLDFTRKGYRRRCEIVGEHGNIIWDYYEGVFLNGKVKQHKFTEGKGFKTSYLNEMECFLRAVKDGVTIPDSLMGGLRTLEVSMAARDGARESKVVLV